MGQLSWLRQLNDDEREARIKQAWRSLKATVDGQVALASLFELLKVVGEVTSPGEMTLHNAGVAILHWIDDDAETRVIDALVAGGA